MDQRQRWWISGSSSSRCPAPGAAPRGAAAALLFRGLRGAAPGGEDAEDAGAARAGGTAGTCAAASPGPGRAGLLPAQLKQPGAPGVPRAAPSLAGDISHRGYRIIVGC